jgi:hypothetical protein
MYQNNNILSRVNISIEKLEETDEIRMVYRPAVKEDPEHIFPVEPIEVRMKLGSMEHYTNKIANYSFAATIIVSWAFSVLMV